jgi:hypothetical protein
MASPKILRNTGVNERVYNKEAVDALVAGVTPSMSSSKEYTVPKNGKVFVDMNATFNGSIYLVFARADNTNIIHLIDLAVYALTTFQGTPNLIPLSPVKTDQTAIYPNFKVQRRQTDGLYFEMLNSHPYVDINVTLIKIK